MIVRMSKHFATPLEPAPVRLEALVSDAGTARCEVHQGGGMRSMSWTTKAEGFELEAEVLHKMCTLLAECLADEMRAHNALRDLTR